MSKKLPSFETPFETYTSSKVIGEGGTGRVYEVTNSTGEISALKCLAPVRVTSERLKRFKNEIEFCQRNIHPKIVRVIDTGVTSIEGTKCPFYVMKRYSGTLRTLLGTMNPDEAMHIYTQILDGIANFYIPQGLIWRKL
jgi:serine/threonine protein kinase